MAMGSIEEPIDPKDLLLLKRKAFRVRTVWKSGMETVTSLMPIDDAILNFVEEIDGAHVGMTDAILEVQILNSDGSMEVKTIASWPDNDMVNL